MPVIKTDLYGNFGNALEFSASYQLYIIAPNVIVAGDSFGYAVYSAFDHSSFANHGIVESDYYSAVHFVSGADYSTILNYSDGIFAGLTYGVELDANNVAVSNYGGISGFLFYGIYSTGDHANFVNGATGSIDGNYGGILSQGSHSNVTNSGTINGQVLDWGVGVTLLGDDSTIHNNTAGTIVGGWQGVDAQGVAQSIWNAGSIIGDFRDGVHSSGQSVIIQNVASGLIHGSFAGINSTGNDATIVNAGTVTASGNYGILLDYIAPAGAASAGAPPFGPGPVDHIQNSGTIFGPETGIEVRANQYVEIDNTGLIHSTGVGIDVDTFGGQLTVINNLGTIYGDGGSVTALTAVEINNGKSGVMAIDVTLGGDVDTVTNFGTIYGDVNLGAGNDFYYGKGDGDVRGTIYGGDGNDTLIGSRGNDTLSGDANNDVLKGRDGNDTLTGGLGTDKMFGGTGADTFVFTKSTESNTAHIDTIADFSHADGDLIDLSLIDANITGGNPGIQHFAFDGTSAVFAAGHLSYSVDINGNATVNGYTNNDATPDLVIQLLNVASLLASDFILS